MNQNILTKDNQWGLYIHWPYCLSLCPYCDFNRTTKQDMTSKQWRDTIIADLNYSHNHEMPQQNNMKLASVFFGGGTPSLANPQHIADILSEVKKLWECNDNCEITLEANPTTVESTKFKDFSQAGINRLSLGIQSLKDEALQYLGRTYSASQAHKAINIATTHFNRVNLDFIYARTADEQVKVWLDELQSALDYQVGHYSLYQLTLEKHTPFFRQAKAGNVKVPSESLAARLYCATRDKMRDNGYKAYEVSNFCTEAEESQHNLIYWNYGLYSGIGPGAHGRINRNSKHKYASERAKSPLAWKRQTQTQPNLRPKPQKIPELHRFEEKLMMGLRLYDGINLNSLKNEAPNIYPKFLQSPNLQSLQESGYMNVNKQNIYLTDNGILRLNAIIDKLINYA